MTSFDYILPMTKIRRIIFITYEGAELLDLAGPSSVFSTASRLSGKSLYSLVTASLRGGIVRHGCGTSVDTVQLGKLKISKRDTLLVVGAYADCLGNAMRDTKLVAMITEIAKQAERIGSICTGAFILGEAGILSGKRAATHWAGQRQLNELYPEVLLDEDSLYVVDGKLWTSAGVTAGIDMALAMVCSDHGVELKSQIAKQLVVYAHRPGHQSQFSQLLVAQATADERFTPLLDWLHRRLDKPTRVVEMADFVGMSERSFHRAFTASFETSPSKFFEQMRLDASKEFLESGLSVKQVMAITGFKSEAAFRKAFRAKYGITPGMHRRMHDMVKL